MAGKTHIWPEDTIETDGAMVVRVTIESPDKERRILWYRVPVEYRGFLTKTADPFVLGTLFSAMRKSTDLYIHDQVTPSLLRSLEEFQAAWKCWRPNRYAAVEINADVEREETGLARSDKAIVAFSGGVDSCFTVWRHRRGNCRRLAWNLESGALIHGFDIPLDEAEAFGRAAENSRKMLEGLGMNLVTISTSFRQLEDNWEDAHGAAIASCLMLLQGRYSTGLIASTEPYNNLVLPWGSNPVTDCLMSSGSFRIVHDGASFSRNEKIRELRNWPEALRYLRVCWEGKEKDRNCGSCEKCIRTILNLRVEGLGVPECFRHDINDHQILGLKGLNSVQIAYLEEILAAAKRKSVCGSWVGALEKCIKRNRRAANGKAGFLRKIRKAVGLRRRLRRLTSSSGIDRQWVFAGSGADR